MASDRFQIKQIDHVTIVVKDLEASRVFYEDILGMQVVDRPNFPFEGIWLQAGTTQIHLIQEHDLSGPVLTALPEQASLSRTRHFAFEVDNAMAADTVMKKHGVKVVSGPKIRPDGPVQIFVLDPDNHVVELFSYELKLF